jgi:flagellin-like protein
MDLKKLFNNNKAVSPVIGVVLMVAITVILAAAIGSSVFGQGTAKSAPQANIDIKAINATSNGWIKFEHLGGDPIHFETDNSTTKVMVSVNGANSVELGATNLSTFDVGDIYVMNLPSNASVSSGESLNVKIIDVQTKQLICDRTVRF